MNIRLVWDVSRILLLLLKGKSNVNTIIKQTGIYKNNVFEAIKFLEKARLASKSKDKKIHRQKVFIQLNEFGQELSNFIVNTEKFEKSFDQLHNTVRGVYHLPENTEEKAIPSLLLNRGLNRQEIDRYEDHIIYAEAFERDSISILIDGIANKYALFLLESSPNNYAKEFLNEITTRRLSHYMLIRIESIVRDEHFRSDKYEIKQIVTKNRINEMVEENGLLFFDFLEGQVYIPYNYRHIRNEVKNIIACLFSIFHLPKEYVERRVKKEIEKMDRLPPPKVSPYLDEAEVKRNADTKRRIYNYVAELNTSA